MGEQTLPVTCGKERAMPVLAPEREPDTWSSRAGSPPPQPRGSLGRRARRVAGARAVALPARLGHHHLRDHLANVGNPAGTTTLDRTAPALYAAAEPKLRAAAEESGLVARADQNTEAMLRTLLGPLGYDDVHVVFEDHPE